MTDSSKKPEWSLLLRIARDLIQQVNSREGGIIDNWTFGGGTAMMLQINHRESRDVDIFLQDPQLLPFLDPDKQDFQFKIQPSDYRGDGVGSLKLVFPGAGEIDFIVDQPRTACPAVATEIEGEPTLLETIPEIIAKKIIHRGPTITPRDIFDVAAAGKEHEDEIVEALRAYKGEVAEAIVALERLNARFVAAAISELLIKDGYQSIAASSLERAKRILKAV